MEQSDQHHIPAAIPRGKDALQWQIRMITDGEMGEKRESCRVEDNIKINLSEIGLKGANWIQLAQDTDRTLQ
jgi:hypothetical protein